MTRVVVATKRRLLALVREINGRQHFAQRLQLQPHVADATYRLQWADGSSCGTEDYSGARPVLQTLQALMTSIEVAKHDRPQTQIEPIGFFETPKDMDDLMSRLEMFAGSERAVAMTAAAMAWNLAAKVTKS